MPTRAQKIRLGIFIVLTSVVFIALIAFFTSERYLRETDTYYISYEGVSVSGLEVGSPVKYLGVKVGRIDDIRIDPEDVNRIIVKVELKQGTPIKADAQADIVSLGITGLKMIEIRGATKDTPLLKEGEFIAAGSSVTEEITGKAEIIAEKAERVLNNLQGFTRPENLDKITRMVETANQAFEKMDGVLTENRDQVREIVLTAREATVRLDSTSRSLQAAARVVRGIVASDTVAQILAGARDISVRLKEVNFQQLIRELGEVVDRTNRLLVRINHDVERGSVDFLTSMRQLRSALENLNQVSLAVQEDPSVLIRGTTVKNAPDQHLDQ